MRIVFSDHAVERVRERRILKLEVFAQSKVHRVKKEAIEVELFISESSDLKLLRLLQS